MAITIIVTNAGRAALVNAANTGTNAVTITQLGVTAAVFVPNAAQVALPGEIKRIASVAGLVVADDQIHLTASDVTPDAYAMRGFGLYLADGTLFAIYGQAGEILNKTSESMMLLAIDVAFADINAEMIVFGDTNFVLPPASTEILGLVELATTTEGQAGSDATRVLTPLVGKQSVLGWLLSQDGSGSGLDADMLDGLHAASFLLGANFTGAEILARLMTVDGTGSGLDADTLDGMHAAAFALAGHTHGTMAAQNANNVNITGGSLSGVTLSEVTALGIGVAAGATKLHIKGSSEVMRLETTTPRGGGLCSQFWRDPTGVKGYFGYAGANDQIYLVNGLNASLIFGTNNQDRMTLTASGDLGLGNNEPAGKLGVGIGGNQVGFNAGAAAAAVKGNLFYTTDGTGWKFQIGKYQGAAFYPQMTFQDNGSVGIGTEAPAYLLEVAGPGVGAGVIQPVANFKSNSDAANNSVEVRLSPITAGQTRTSIGARREGATNNAALFFAVGGAERFQIDSTGNITPATDGQQILGWPTARLKEGHFSDFVRVGGNNVWHAGNDGSGSGLDADLLDGQHGAYYLPAASYTAPDVLAKIATVDGSGSGLDADLLDGRHASEFVLGTSFPASFAQNGYQYLPNGLIIQWGRFTALANQYTNAFLPISFPNNAFSAVVAGVAGGGADSQDNAPSITGLSVNSLQVYSADNSNTIMHFIAIGY